MPTQQTLLTEMLSTTREITNDEHKRRALRGAARLLAGEQLAEALQMADALSDPFSRSYTLAYLARRLPENERAALVETALPAARRIPDAARRATVLNMLAEVSPPAGQAQIAAEAIEAILQMDESEDQVRELAALPASAAPEALRIAEHLNLPWIKALALIQLSARLPDEYTDGVLSSALEISEILPDLEQRLLVWSSLYACLPDEARPEWSERLLAAAAASRDSLVVFNTLDTLAADLSPEQLFLALDLAHGIVEASHRVDAYGLLAARLTPEGCAALASDALRELSSLTDDFTLSGAIDSLSAYLPTERLPALIEHAERITDGWAKAQALAAISRRLAGHERSTVLEAATTAARSLASPWKRARALTIVAAASG